MPTETKDEPIHPSLADHETANEAFFTEAAEIFEARRAPLNPIADKLSQAALGTNPPRANQDQSNASSPRSPASQTAAPTASQNAADAPAPGKIPGIAMLEAKPGEGAAAESQSASNQPQSAPAPDPDEGVPSLEDYKGNKATSENWKKLYGSKEQWKKQANELRQKLEQIQRQPQNQNGAAANPEIEKAFKALQSERDNLIARIEAIAVEKSPRFEAAFKPRVEAAISQAKAAVGSDKAKRVEDILNLPESAYRDEQIDAILQEIGSNFRQSKLTQAVAEIDRVNAERHALASRGSEIYKQWQADEQRDMQRQRQEREQQAIRTFDTELQGWQQAGYLKDEKEASVARDVFIGKGDLEDAARASMWAVVGPKLASSSMEKDKRIRELEAELAKFRSVQPGRETSGGNAPTASDDIPSDAGYGEAIGRLVQQAGYLR